MKTNPRGPALEEPLSADQQALTGNFRKNGTVAWVGVRPERKKPLIEQLVAQAVEGKGLEGDRVMQVSSLSRQVTFIMGEHLDSAARILGVESIDPGLTRRNVVTRGINLLALKDRKFKIGEAVFELTKPCHPCSRMEENLGNGGFNAMRGHGGWCAIVVQGGKFKPGDEILPL